MHRLFIALILLSLTCGSYAAEVNNLYQAEMPVSSRDEQERATLAPLLLRQVMLKVVGNEAMLASADLEPVLSQAEQFMQKYEYQRRNLVAVDLTQPDVLSLKLSFDASAVNQAIQNLNLPVWGKIRPDVLTWIAVDIEGEQSLLGLETAPVGMFKLVSKAADQRGLPVVMPLMDLQDQSALRFSDISTADATAVKGASARYGTDVVLAAFITVKDDSASIDWQAWSDTVSEKWTTQGEPATAIEQGIAKLTDMLALSYSQFADNDGQQQRLKLQISNVMGYADFSRLMAYLNQLSLITDIRVNNLDQQQLDLDIAFNGSMDILQRTLAVGRLLTEESSYDGNEAKHYRLLP